MLVKNKKVTTSVITSLGLILLIAITMVSCEDPKFENPSPDVSHLNPPIVIHRLDSIFALSDKKVAVQNILEFQEKYPAFFDIYFTKLVPIYNEDPVKFEEQLYAFMDHEQISNLLDTTQIVFPDLNFLRADLKKAMSYYQHYFPESEVPNFYSLVSEFGVQSFIFQDGPKDGVGIGLDMFLGDHFDYKVLDPRNPAFSDYLTQYYKKEYIIKNAVEVILEDRLGTRKGSNLLSQMVNAGKKLYILEKILPFAPKEVVLGFSEDELAWLERNEIEMWSFFLEKELLYETSNAKTFKYLNPSPGSPGMPAEAPGRTGAYIGFKIVENYMNRNSSTSLNELIEMDDAQKMITKYKPPRR